MRGVFTRLNGVETTPLPASTPDITKAQVGGWLQFAASVGVGVGLLRPDEATVLIGASGLVAFGIHLGDAIIRNGRAKAVATLATAGVALSDGFMGKNAPKGEEIPESPTLRGYDPDGTGTVPPPDTGADDSSPTVTTAAPTGPTAEDIAAATEAVQASSAAAQDAVRVAKEAQARLEALQAQRTPPPPVPRPQPDQQQ